ncbi:accessory gene regulator B family protein [Ruminococcus sp.]|jgi:accessory gene regulator protein AgrB|uniref:accessory gene regulator B family protein n=1 Tax=Ruminococcus sp. TaxID=41978 RepID=UPI0025FEFC8E|nr:accessory gene regulator B family protein [Ruminococcus sp.]
MDKILNAIMKKLLRNGYVKNDDAEIVRYGLEITIMKTVLTSLALIIAAILKSFIAIIIFLMFFIMLRSCCGGYHSSSRIGCIILSITMLMIIIVISKLLRNPERLYVSALFSGTGAIIITIFAPTETPTKPFDDIERKVFRRRSLIATAIAIAIAAVTAALRLYMPLLSVSSAIFVTAVLLIAGRISNRKGAKI